MAQQNYPDPTSENYQHQEDGEYHEGEMEEGEEEGYYEGEEGEEGMHHYHHQEEEPEIDPEIARQEELQRELAELEHFELKDKTVRDEDDPSGRTAYIQTCERLELRFPIDSIVSKLDDPENPTVLNLHHCGLGDKGAEALAAAIRVNPRIQELSLVDNFITPVGGRFIVEELTANKTIKTVNMSKNRLGSRAAAIGANASIGHLLSRLLSRNNTILELKLEHNSLGDTDVCKICEGVVDNTTLIQLHLAYNDIGVKGGEAISNVLKQNAELQYLDLSWNKLGSRGSRAVLEGLERNNTVKKFCLSWNGVDDAAGVLLGTIIGGSSALETIEVAHNRIGPKGADAIAKGIMRCTSLLSLDLSENPIRDRGCAAIAKSLREGETSVTTVNLSSQTEVGLATMKEFQMTRKMRDKITIIPPPSVFEYEEFGEDEAADGSFAAAQ